MNYTDEQTFNGNDFTTTPLPKGEFEQCVFNNCNFADCDLSGYQFIDCEFHGCNLSMVALNKTLLQGVTFADCKILGVRFNHCDPFGLAISFDHCQLNHCSFFQLKLAKTTFRNCQLLDADLVESDLSETTFDNCDLAGAVFEQTNLEKADLATSYNYTLDPESNTVKNARFSLSGLPGLLEKYDLKVVP